MNIPRHSLYAVALVGTAFCFTSLSAFAEAPLNQQVPLLTSKTNHIDKQTKQQKSSNHKTSNQNKDRDNQKKHLTYNSDPNYSYNNRSPSLFHSDSLSMLSGYTDAGYINRQGEKGHFALGHFNPIFKYLYKNRALAAAELETELESNGETEVKLEYADISIFLNDYMAFFIGKSMSPLGQFVQNIHPSWINKLPSNPAGFNHDQAAPEAEIGAGFRGGFHVGHYASSVNYAVFVANGPKAIVSDGMLDEIDTSGFNSNPDGDMVFGGRIGVLPVPNLEIGVSGAVGRVGLFEEDDPDKMIESGRDYSVLGVDATWLWRGLNVRGEFIQQRISSKKNSEAPVGQRWYGYYAQTSYRIPRTNFEPVVRYSKYRTPIVGDRQRQWAFGLDYWFEPNLVAKAAYEVNTGEKAASSSVVAVSSVTDEDEETNPGADAFIFQLAYGF